MLKKVTSVCLSIVVLISCILPYSVLAYPDMVTTQEPASKVNTTASLVPYAEFNSKCTDGAFYIPGLNSTVSYNKEFKCYAANNTMVPQAMCAVGQYTLITAYDSAEAARSVIYVLENKNLIKTFILPDSYHVGGIAYDIQNRAILVTKGTKGAVGVISLEDFQSYLNFNSDFIKIAYTVSESTASKKISTASGVAYKDGRVYLSAFGSGSGSFAYCYTPYFDRVRKTYYLTYKYKMSLPNYTQGITITKYKNETWLFVSVSYGRSEKMNIYCSYLYTYSFNEKTGSRTLDNVLTCPAMLQQTYASGGKLYCLFESAASLYKSENKNPVDMVLPVKLSKICAENKGASLNLSASNVVGGKKIKASVNIKGAAIYYSAGMPYIRAKKVVNAYKYTKPYVKTAGGTVYAVAVKDGRIVASDALKVSVSKTAAPSRLKIKSKSSTAVNLGWTKVSTASGYYVYRSTSAKGKYTLVGTVNGNKNSFKDSTVRVNTTYYYKVKAYRKGYSNSAYTAYVLVRT